MTKILSKVLVEALDDYKYVKLVAPFIFVSDVLRKAGYDGKVLIPTDFVFDYESIPLIKGTSKRGGLGHDYFYRINSVPVVSRKIADKVYLELMTYRKNTLWRRFLKYFAVRLLGKSNYHKLRVEATYEEVMFN